MHSSVVPPPPTPADSRAWEWRFLTSTDGNCIVPAYFQAHGMLGCESGSGVFLFLGEGRLSWCPTARGNSCAAADPTQLSPQKPHVRPGRRGASPVKSGHQAAERAGGGPCAGPMRDHPGCASKSRAAAPEGALACWLLSSDSCDRGLCPCAGTTPSPWIPHGKAG